MAQNAIIVELSRALTTSEVSALNEDLPDVLPEGVDVLGLTATASAADSEYLSVPETAKRLDISQQRVRQLLDEGKLTGQKIGRDWNVAARSVQDRLDASA
jgi:excisionase family DNA binding protein